MSKTYSATTLLKSATKWLMENEGKPLPREGHLSPESNASFYSSQAYYLSPANGNRLENIPGRLIPVLAGISLGLDSPSIARIINDHGVKPWHITGLSLSNDAFAPIPLPKEGLHQASGPRLFIEYAKACDTDDDLRVELLDNTNSFPSAEMALANTHVETPAFWPSEMIKNHAQIIMTPTAGQIKNRVCTFETLISAPTVKTDMPHGDPLMLMRRTGMFDDVVLRKLTGRFSFWEHMANLAVRGQDLHIKMIEALRKIEDPKELAIAIRGLISCSVDSAASDFFEGYEVLKLTQDVLKGNEHFKPFLESTIYKLNSVSLRRYSDGFEAMELRPELYQDVLNHKETLLSRVANELLSRPAHQLGYSDYLAISKIARLRLPKQEIAFAPELLINHVLDSVSTYLTPNDVLCLGKQKVDEAARDSLCALAGLVSKCNDLDYSALQARSEDEKLMLIMGGLDVRKFDGLSRFSKAAILEQQLGL